MTSKSFLEQLGEAVKALSPHKSTREQVFSGGEKEGKWVFRVSACTCSQLCCCMWRSSWGHSRGHPAQPAGSPPVLPPVPGVPTAKGGLSTSPLQEALAERQSLGHLQPWEYNKSFASTRGLVCYVSFASALYFDLFSYLKSCLRKINLETTLL